MPRERKKRGRREEKKKKRKPRRLDDSKEPSFKRRRTLEEPSELEVRLDDTAFTGEEYQDVDRHGRKEPQFYGLLDEEEQSYFKRADQMLELNQFTNSEERDLFLGSVWRELNGKELKVACSQSCSRLLERLTQLSSTSQLKTFMQKLDGHLLDLMQHRFASHCCEALFLRSAPVVTDELISGPSAKRPSDDGDEAVPGMEDLFLNAVSELENDAGCLMTDRFGSHTLRVLLLVLSGRPLGDSAATSLLQSKNKENVARSMSQHEGLETKLVFRTIPSSFAEALERLQIALVGPLDSTSLRVLTTHPLASPVLQLLLERELGSKQSVRQEDSLIRKLLPDLPPNEDGSTDSFIQGLVHDPVGSHLLETVVRFAPAKIFKPFYRKLLRPDLKTITRHEIATFVLVRSLERLSADDLQSAMEEITPEVPRLVSQGRTSLIRCLIERCDIRNADSQPLVRQLEESYGSIGPDYLPRILAFNVDHVREEAPIDAKVQASAEASKKAHASLLVQSMLRSSGPLRNMVEESLVCSNPHTLSEFAKDRSATHIIQAALAPDQSSQSFRRKFVPKFSSFIHQLAVDPIASHVIDALWAATSDLHFLRENIADKMASAEAELKASYCGRAVWRNWMMDFFKRRRASWIAKTRSTEEGVDAKPSLRVANSGASRAKTALELAQERFVKNQRRGLHSKFKSQGRPKGTALASG